MISCAVGDESGVRYSHVVMVGIDWRKIKILERHCGARRYLQTGFWTGRKRHSMFECIGTSCPSFALGLVVGTKNDSHWQWSLRLRALWDALVFFPVAFQIFALVGAQITASIGTAQYPLALGGTILAFVRFWVACACTCDWALVATTVGAAAHIKITVWHAGIGRFVVVSSVVVKQFRTNGALTAGVVTIDSQFARIFTQSATAIASTGFVCAVWNTAVWHGWRWRADGHSLLYPLRDRIDFFWRDDDQFVVFVGQFDVVGRVYFLGVFDAIQPTFRHVHVAVAHRCRIE